MRDLWPGAIASHEFDSFAHDATIDPSPAIIHTPGYWLTGPQLEWGPRRWALDSYQVLDLEGGTIELDVDRVTDEMLRVEAPIHVVPSRIGWAQGLTGEAAWAAVPVGQCVRNGRVICNYSKLAEKAQKLGVSLRISGPVLQGHSASIENVEVVDAGALGHESFPARITGALSGYDRNALSTADPAHEFDEDESLTESYMTDPSISGFVSHASNDQVTSFMIDGATTNDRLDENGAEVGEYRQIFRRTCHITRPRGVATGDNQFQLATIYQCREGLIDEPYCRGFHAGVYGDYCSTFNLTVLHGDLEALRPVAQLLSPTASGTPFYRQFFSRGLRVVSSKLKALPTDSDQHGGLYLNCYPPYDPPREIAAVVADDNDFIMVGAPRAGNVAVRARHVSGLHILPTNRFAGFNKLFDIDAYSEAGGEHPPELSSRGGCARLIPFRR